jgi:SET domain-containing protein
MADYRNGYVFYFNLKYVIDAWRTKKSVAHFANDAAGIVRVKGLKNNTEYTTKGKRCFITATEDIPAKAEILVDYGREYWQAIRYNIREEKRKNERAGKKTRKGTLPHQAASQTRKRTDR